jgi:hypothetical protein
MHHELPSVLVFYPYNLALPSLEDTLIRMNNFLASVYGSLEQLALQYTLTGPINFVYALPVGNHRLLLLQILQFQMSWQTGLVQLGFFLTSSTFSRYLHLVVTCQQKNDNPAVKNAELHALKFRNEYLICNYV